MKTNLDSIFKQDENLELTGIWFQISDKIKFKLRRFGGSNTAAMNKHSAKIFKPYAQMIKAGTVPEDKMEELSMTLFIRSCLVDWKGVEDDGKELECNEENAIKLFKHLPELIDKLIKYADSAHNYKAEFEQTEELGKS